LENNSAKTLVLFSREGPEEEAIFFTPSSTLEIKEREGGRFVYPQGMPLGEVLEYAQLNFRYPFVLICDSNTRPFLGVIKGALARLTTPFGMIYGDHMEEEKRVKSFQDPGDITGRFPYGPVRIYAREVIKNYLNHIKRFTYGLEYALWLRLEEEQLPRLYVGEVFGERKGRMETPRYLSSFDYLFSLKDREREEEKIFKDMLKRRGAFLRGPFMTYTFERPSFPPLVSVIIPVRNRVGTIEAAIGSVLDQTYKNFEVIVVDTGSTDGTIEKVEKLRRKFEKVRLIKLKGGEISHALNAGVKNARGEFIAQLDSDDFYVPETIEECVEVLSRNPEVALVVSYYQVVDEEGNPIRGISPIKHLEYDRNNLLRSDGIGAVRVWRKGAIESLGGFDEKTFGHFGEDYDMALRISERWEVQRIHRVLYKYRRHGDSVDIKTGLQEKFLLKTLARQRALQRRKRFNEIRALSRALRKQ